MKRLKIVLIGAGNVATHVGNAFNNNGHQILQVFSKQIENASELADKIGAESIDSIEQLNLEADLYLMAVKDDRIAELCKKINLKDKILVHTSGTISMEVLGVSSSQYGVFYPLQTFSKFKKLDLKTVPFCIEGNTPDVSNVLKEIANELSDVVQVVDSAMRKKIHLAAVFACNFSNHMYAIAEDLLKKDNVSLDIIRPLIEETARKAMTNSPEEVQTGPAIRNDKQVLSDHIELLSSNTEWKKIYEQVSQSIQQHYK